jgi:hypothetical protein
MGSNTLTNLIPDAYQAMDVVSRELVGLLPAVARNIGAERAAVGQQVRSFVTPAATATDITPAVIPPDDGDQTIGNIPMTITKAKRVPFRWNGEQSRGINNGGPGVLNIQQDQIAQAMRTLTNLMEADLAALYANASRATGTAGTTPFASTLGDPAQVRKILDDNGAPAGQRSLIIDTAAGAAMRTLATLNKTNEVGSSDFRTQGTLIDIHGFLIRESAQILTPAIGTSSNTGTTNTAGYALGATAITLAAAGTGTILAGDIVTFTGDTNKYVVASGVASLAAGGVLTLAAPGLKKALATSAITVTVTGVATRSMGFSRNALAIAQRLPALPDEGDMAADRTTITDPRSGFSFEIAMYKQYRQVQWEISCAWGVAAFKPEHMALLLG